MRYAAPAALRLVEALRVRRCQAAANDRTTGVAYGIVGWHHGQPIAHEIAASVENCIHQLPIDGIRLCGDDVGSQQHQCATSAERNWYSTTTS